MYFSSAVSKLRGGLSFVTGSTLQAFLLQNGLIHDVPSALVIARSPVLAGVFAVGALAFELFFGVVVVWPRTAIPFAIAGIAFHISIREVMSIEYTHYFLPSYVIFVNCGLVLALRSLYLAVRTRFATASPSS
jgi:hypothetical protein